MSSFEVINQEQAAVREIRSYLAIIRRYRNTSMAYHGRCVEATYLLAAELLIAVMQLEEANPGSVLVAQWAAKFMEYVGQYELASLPKKGQNDGKASEGKSTVQPNIGSNRANKET